MKKRYYKIILLFTIQLMCISHLFGQDITITVPNNITVCEDNQTVNVQYTNTTTATLTNQVITIVLPTGIEYIAGSLLETTSFNFQEVNVSNNSNLRFSASEIGIGQSVEFSFEMRAVTESIDFLNLGNVFRNEVTVTHDNGSNTEQSDAYNLLYAALNITSLSPTSQTITSGGTTTRNITVVNAGFGRTSSFYIVDIHGSNLSLTNVNIGTLNVTKDTIFLSGTDFNSIGNNDNYFDNTESITITQTLTGTACSDVTESSVIRAGWGCEGEYIETTNSNAHISIDFQSPNLGYSSTSELNACFGEGSASKQTITINNTGAGTAQNILLDIYKSLGSGYDETIYSRIDANSITYKLDGGNIQAISPTTTYSTTNTGNYSCLGSNSIGRAVLSLPDLASGSSYEVSFDMYHCDISVCTNDKVTGWQYDVSYEDACGISTSDTENAGQSVNNDNMAIFTESPIDISDGEKKEYRYTISTHENSLPEGGGAHYELAFTFDAGLVWDGNTEDLVFHSNAVNWTATSTTYDAIARTLIAKYPLPAPFTIDKSEIQLFLTGDCNEPGATSGNVNIELDINYFTSDTCSPNFSIPFVCNETVTSYLHCPISCDDGGYIAKGFDIQRTSFGDPDNDENGLPDSSGSIDLNKVKSNRVMVGDTLRTTFRGIVGISGNNPQWDYGYASSNIEMGSNLSAITGSLKVYDASTTSYLNCDGVSISSVINGNDQTFNFDFSPATLTASCGSFSGFQFEDGDSIWLYIDYEVTGNIGGDVHEVSVFNDIYFSNIANPTNANDKFTCGEYDGRFTMIGYFFNVATQNNVTIKECSKEIEQSFYLSIGNCCTNYDGGNLFPYEYRNWANIKEAKVVIPENYEVLNIRFQQKRTRRTNSSATQTENSIVADLITGDTLYFNLEQYYETNGGNIRLSDDGFSGTLFVEIAPTCDVPVNTYQAMPWEFNFTKADIIGGGTSGWMATTTPDYVRFKPASLALSSTNPIIDGLEKTITWNLQVLNTSTTGGANNAWVHLLSANDQIQILKFYDVENNQEISLTGDIYQIGEIAKNNTRNFEITASYSNCSPQTLNVYSGYECSGYPTNFASFVCPYSVLDLKVEPKDAQLQAIINGTTVGSECSSIVQLDIEVNSTKLAVADSVWVTFTMPASGNGIDIVTGSATFKYPLSSSFQSISDPLKNFNVYSYDIGNLNTRIQERGLPGVLELDSNRFQLQINVEIGSGWTPGDYVLATIGGKHPCGDNLSPINLAFDPSVKFESNTSAGITADVGDSWSASWGDYDNDGFDDLYVTEYSASKPNILYHNNGDGTFTKISSGDIVTDVGVSISSTWGDYNNDGYLDLFVANNIGTPNRLYQNNGDGTFTKITSGNIVEYDGYCHGASWADYDNDGYLDLLVTDFFAVKFNKLYHNNGDGTFADITNTPISVDATSTLGATWADYDNDNDQDLFVPRTEGTNSLYRNEGNGQFTEITTGEVVTDNGSSVGSSWGDYNNDGYLDLFVANAGNENNFLYQNNGDGTFTKITSGEIVNDGGNSHGSAWADFNNDGFLDLIVTNDQFGLNYLYSNNGDGSFTKFENLINTEQINSFGTAWSDYDKDGDMDLYIANHSNQLNTFYTNSRASCNSWSCIDLEGIISNKNGIGAKVRVKANIYGQDVWQMREISAQTGGGSGGQNSMNVLFGLGDATSIDSIQIEWPSGIIQYFTNQAPNTCLEVPEENSELICGTVYHDTNANCTQDAGEVGIANAVIEILPGPRYITTDENGDYQISLVDGSYTVNIQVQSGWTINCPASGYALNVTSGGNYCGQDFSITTSCTDPDLEASIHSTSLRRGFRNTFLINYANNGVSNATGIDINVELDNDLVPVSAIPAWNNIVPGATSSTYIWNLDTIKAMSNGTIELIDSVSVSATIGSFADASVSFSNVSADCNYSDNVALSSEEIVGSFDPNDIQVFPKGVGTRNLILPDQKLTYKVRFQNVGNYYASIVIIKDTLPEYLDISTIKTISTTHPFQMKVNDNIVRWEAWDIFLPDSTSDLENSQGFVVFEIMPKEDIDDFSVINNRAGIQFDYNEDIITNRVFNTVDYNLNNRHEEDIALEIYPNPSDKFTSIRLISLTHSFRGDLEIQGFKIFNAHGEQIKEQSNIQQTYSQIDLTNLPKGMYYILVNDIYDRQVSGKLIRY